MATIRIRRNTAAAAASSNPVLAAGEPGFETDTGVLKIGDGTTAWNDLDPITGGGSSNFLGLYTSLANLETAHATASSGNWAIVDPGSGTDAVKYLWDEDEGWVAGGSGPGVLSVSGDGVDNTDPANPVISFPAISEPLTSTGSSIKFDVDRFYGEAAPITGALTFDSTDFSKGTTCVVRHNDDENPFSASDAEFVVVGGEYIINEDNYIYMHAWSASVIHCNIIQHP